MNLDPKALGSALGAAVKALLDPIRKRLDRLEQLEARVAELERSLEQRSYKGVWDGSVTYQEHNSVSLAGCLWIAKRATFDRPGTSDAWQLAVKRGRNAKDVQRNA
jgi:hypothetical protein